ncbi:YhcN/YlaJ family sporulation lipoprotein [Schnuerera ultunensis]|uniref:YhcN/YlaJ family sporulation lipoprotein n=1 Tax=Schnuerera ultunensis TaxID=45497 RepID=UPI00046FBB37|nr:YhcN/YlaJ family sporulation lipoprotein [Schnuerera ultunensis]
MKKNKFLFLAFVLTLVITTIGCTVNRPGTQTRIGQQTPNNNLSTRRDNNMLGMDRRNNNNLVGFDRRNMDNITDMNRTRPNNLVRRNTDLGPNTATEIAPRNYTGMNNVTARANAIAERVAALNEVNRCSVLISGNTAIVGVDMKNNLEGRMTTALKQKIERTVKNMDNNIANVSVTANPDLFTRISTMARDIGAGRPISGFAREFQEILRRITPVR